MQDFASFIRRRRPGWYDQDTDEEAIRNYQADELATAEANPGYRPYLPDYIYNPEPVQVEQEAPREERSGLSAVVSNIGEGARQLGTRAKATFSTLTGDLPNVERLREEEHLPQLERKPTEQRELETALSSIDTDQPWTGQVVDVAKAFASNPTGGAQLITEQLANALPSLAGMFGGAKLGAAAGATIGPIGAIVGSVSGMLLGGIAGVATTELGAEALQKAEDGFTGEEREEAIHGSLVKSAVIGSVDTLTARLPIARTLIPKGAAEAGERAAAKVLTDNGIDATSAAAIRAAAPEVKAAATQAAAQTAWKNLSNTQKAGIVAASLGVETVGEGAGELLGELAKTGELDVVGAATEAIAGFGQSAATTAITLSSGGQAMLDQVSAKRVAEQAAILNQSAQRESVAKIADAPDVDSAITAAVESVTKPVTTTTDLLDNEAERQELLRQAEALTGDTSIVPGSTLPGEASLAVAQAREEASRAEAQAREEAVARAREERPANLGTSTEMATSTREALAGDTNIIPDSTLPEQAGEQASRPANLGTPTEIVTPTGESLDADWEVVSASQLAAGQQVSDSQPRDRTRASSEAQVQRIASALDYRRMSDSPVMDVGAPTVSPDGSIVAGNGRVMAAQRAYQQGTADDYRQRLIQDAQRKGVNPEAISSIPDPVLVRRLRTPPEDISALARQSNEGSTLTYSATETARLDSERMKNLSAIEFTESGALKPTEENARAVIAAIADYSPAELGQILDAQGSLTQDGARRIRNAALYRAYGDSPALTRLVESTDQGSRNIAQALVATGPRLSEARGNIQQTGQEQLDPREAITQAVDVYERLHSQGVKVDDYLNQEQIGGRELTPAGEHILKILSDNRNKPARLREELHAIYDAIDRVALRSSNQSLVEDEQPLTLEQVLQGDAVADTDDVYDRLEVRPDTNERQKELGRAVLKDTTTKAERLIRAAVARREGHLLASNLPKDLKENGGASLIGQTVSSPVDLALAAQVLRDPRFETFRVFYLKNNRIIHHTATTTRLPGTAPYTQTGSRGERDRAAEWRFLSEMSVRIMKLGADGVYLMHNHPSGSAQASLPDIDATIAFAEAFPRHFKGHIIIDHNEFGVVEGDGTARVERYNFGADSNAPVIAPHNLLNKPFTSFRQGADLLKQLERKDGFFTLVALTQQDQHMVIGSIADFPEALLENPRKLNLLGALRRFGRGAGSEDIIAVTDRDSALLKEAVDSGVLLNIISTDGLRRYDTRRQSTWGSNLMRGARLRFIRQDFSESSRTAEVEAGATLETTGETPPSPEMPVQLLREETEFRVDDTGNFVLPETEEYADNMTGDLATLPKGIPGVKAAPIRLEIGVAKEQHRGVGMLHVVDNVTDPTQNRRPRRTGEGLAEDVARDIVHTLKGVSQVYRDDRTEGRPAVFLYNAKKKAAIKAALSEDGSYYSVITHIPNTMVPNNLGNPARQKSNLLLFGNGFRRGTPPLDRASVTAATHTPTQMLTRTRRKYILPEEVRGRQLSNEDRGAPPSMAQPEPEVASPEVVSPEVASPNTTGTPRAEAPPEETRLDAFRRTFQDANLRFKRVQDWVKEQGIKLSELSDVYTRENISKGVIANKIEDFRNDEVKPLLDEMSKAKIKLEDVTTYLEAQHAPEANARMRKIHDDPKATASGMTDKEAEKLMEEFRARDDFEQFKTLADRLQNIGRQTLDMRLEAGTISQEMYDAYNAVYKHWVPLRSDIFAGDETATRRKVSSSMQAKVRHERRFGHGKTEEYIFENLILDRERAIMEIEKNKIALSVMSFLMEAKNPNIGTIDRPEKMQVIKDHTYTTTYNGRVVASHDTEGAAIKAVDNLLQRNDKFNRKDFEISRSYDPHAIALSRPQLAENEIQAYVNGHSIRMQLNDELLARAATASGIEGAGMLVQAGLTANRFLSKAYTAWNPEFMSVNLVRDLFSGTAVLAGKKGAAFLPKVWARYPRAMKELFKAINDPKKSEWVKEYRRAGGNINAAYLADIERIGQDAMRALDNNRKLSEVYQSVYKDNIRQGKSKTMARTKAALRAGVQSAFGNRIVAPMVDFIERLNAVVENTMRLATFKAAIDDGMSAQQAARLSRDLMNFNRKGELADTMSAMYLFFNPAMQGTHIVAEALLTSPHRKQVRAMMAGIVATSYLIAQANRGEDDDDWEAIPEYVRDRNLVFGTGETQVTIPVPYGFGWFHSLGNALSDLQAGEDADKLALRLGSALLEQFTPVNTPFVDSGDRTQLDMLAVSPTAVQMAVAPSVNRDSLGRTIAPEAFPGDSRPDSQRMFRTARGTIYEDVAYFLNDVTGGSRYEPGAIDVSPNTLKYWVTSLTGGAGKTISDTSTMLGLLAEGITPDIAEVPILRKAVREHTVRDSRQLFYKAANETKAAIGHYRNALKEGDLMEAESVMSEKGPIVALARYAEASRKQSTALQDAMVVINNSDLTTREKRMQIKELERREQSIYDEFLKIFKQAEQRT